MKQYKLNFFFQFVNIVDFLIELSREKLAKIMRMVQYTIIITKGIIVTRSIPLIPL